MANDNTKLQYIVELLTTGDTKKATDELKKLGQAGDAATKGINSTSDSAKQLFAFLGGTTLIMQSVEKFLEAERGINALNYALEQTGNNAPGALDAVKGLADALGDDLKVQADDVIKVMTQLIAFGANPKDLKRLTMAVYDLSETMGRDVGRASRQMSQALKGNFEVFTALGIEVDKTKFATEGYNEAFDKMERMISGRGRASVQGVAGDIQALGVTLEDAKQQLGKWEAAVLTAVAKVSENVADLWTRPELEQSITRQKDAYLVLADAIGRAILEAEKLGKITKEQAGQMFGRLGGAREILSGGLTDIGQTTSDEDLCAIKEQRLPQAGGLLADLRQRLKPRQAGSPAQAEGPSRIESGGLSEMEINQAFDQLDRMDAAVVESINREAELRARQGDLDDKRSLEALENYRNAERTKQDLVDQTVLTMLDGEAKVIAEMEINHDRRVQMIQDTKFETEEQYMEAMNAEKLLFAEEKRRHAQAQSFSGSMKADMSTLGEQGMRMFSSGLAGAMVDAFEEGDKAFQKFAANFLKQIAEMILEMIIFNTLKAAGKAYFAGGGQSYSGDVNSGAQYANYAADGIQTVSSATYFPKFNTVAGEAGREVLTVLARPSFQRINGVPAQIGYAGGNRLAITSADALANAGGGAGGNITIEVRVSQGSEARIVENSVKQARVQIVQDMSNDTQLSRVTRQKVS